MKIVINAFYLLCFFVSSCDKSLDFEESFFNADEIYSLSVHQYPSRDYVQKVKANEMRDLWYETLNLALKGTRREAGLVFEGIEYGIPQEVSIMSFGPFWGPILEKPEDQGSVVLNMFGAYCGAFHTHPPMHTLSSQYYRTCGPSDNDYVVAMDFDVPSFVYDYDVKLLHGGHALGLKAKIYPFGPLQRSSRY